MVIEKCAFDVARFLGAKPAALSPAGLIKVGAQDIFISTREGDELIWRWIGDTEDGPGDRYRSPRTPGPSPFSRRCRDNP